MPKYDAWMKNEAWLRVVRKLPCFYCGREDDTVEAHHVGARGVGLKEPDTGVIPLCNAHHMSHHQSNTPSLEWCRKALTMLHAALIETVLDEWPQDALDGTHGHLMRALKDAGGNVPLLG